jgi:hypothetical protein
MAVLDGARYGQHRVLLQGEAWPGEALRATRFVTALTNPS